MFIHRTTYLRMNCIFGFQERKECVKQPRKRKDWIGLVVGFHLLFRV